MPETVGEVRSFHGLTSFYIKCIKNFSSLCNIMTEIMRGDKIDFKCTQGAKKSFETFKQKFIELPRFSGRL